MQELLDIIQEESEIMDPENLSEVRTRNALDRASEKIRKDGPTAALTPVERRAIKYALEDVGELYLFAGTSAGFDVESKAQEREHQSRGSKARTQAAALGIYL